MTSPQRQTAPVPSSDTSGRPNSRVGVYPGSFNPPTLAHLAISQAAVQQRQLDELVWMVSHRALGKEAIEQPPFDLRLEVLHDVAADHDWLRVETTEHQLLSEIAEGFAVLIMGADKWHQIQDPIWYGNDPAARDASIRSLPEIAVAPRPPLEVPEALVLAVSAEHHDTSSTAARAGAIDLMAPAARRRASLWLP